MPLHAFMPVSHCLPFLKHALLPHASMPACMPASCLYALLPPCHFSIAFQPCPLYIFISCLLPPSSSFYHHTCLYLFSISAPPFPTPACHLACPHPTHLPQSFASSLIKAGRKTSHCLCVAFLRQDFTGGYKTFGFTGSFSMAWPVLPVCACLPPSLSLLSCPLSHLPHLPYYPLHFLPTSHPLLALVSCFLAFWASAVCSYRQGRHTLGCGQACRHVAWTWADVERK